MKKLFPTALVCLAVLLGFMSCDTGNTQQEGMWIRIINNSSYALTNVTANFHSFGTIEPGARAEIRGLQSVTETLVGFGIRASPSLFRTVAPINRVGSGFEFVFFDDTLVTNHLLS